MRAHLALNRTTLAFWFAGEFLFLFGGKIPLIFCCGHAGWSRNSRASWIARRAGIAATANWLTNAAVAQTFLTLTRALGASGTFWLYAAVACLGGAWAWAWMPETKGLALEDVEELFRRRAGAGPAGAREVALTEAGRSAA